MNLKPLYNHFLKTKEGSWIMHYENGVDLYNFIIKHKIKKVLSLGTGIGFSDSVVAKAFLESKVEGTIDSIEQYDKCIRLANELIPEELKKYIKIHKKDVQVWTSDKMSYQYFSIYDSLPEGDYDLIINDGPAPFLDKFNNFVELPNGTIHKLTLEDKIKPGTFVIYDGRLPSLSLLERYFGGNYYLYKVPKGGSDFFVFQRKENILECKDERYEAFKKDTPYFQNHEEKKNPISCDEQSASCKAEAPIAGVEESK